MKFFSRLVPSICRQAAASFLERSRASRRPAERKSLALLVALAAGNLLTAPSPARAQDTAAAAPFYTFAAASEEVDGYSPSGGLVKGPDGNFYGASYTANGYGQVYRLTPAGQFSVVYQFQGGDDGKNPYDLIVGSDGNFYGAAAGGPSNDGLLFRLTAGGAFTVLHDFNSAVDGSGPSGLVLASDGTFFGTTSSGGPVSGGTGTLYQITPAGKVTVLHTFTQDGDGLHPGTLIAGNDGSYYGTTSGFTPVDDDPFDPAIPATLFRVTLTGTFTTLSTFPILSGVLGPNSLLQASDGSFYGTTSGSSYVHLYAVGTVFRLTAAGDFTTLHQFNTTDGFGPVGLTQASDGNFYGVTTSGGFNSSPTSPTSTATDGTAFQITPAGVFTSLYSFTGGADGSFPDGPLLEVGDGIFYGVASTGGDGVGGTVYAGDGVVYQLTLIRHPDFFAGQAPLADDVYYLAFANGNYFGYYAFLSDPDYLYHFDLGYEYVIDANDGQGDIYLYDFASNGFFYTGPDFPFPYLYDFNLKSVVYYFPDPNDAGHYNIYGKRYFYDFATDQIVAK